MTTERKIVDVRWFNGGTGCIGVVKIEDPYEGTLYYIGGGRGLSEKEDIQTIADWGAKICKSAGESMFNE